MVKRYELIGFINMFNIIPDFVFPVFICDNKYYFQDGNNIQVDNFIEIKETVYSKIQFKNDIKANLKYLTVRNSPIYAFQINKNDIYYGKLKEFLNYIKRYNTEDSILQDEINNFINENKPHVQKINRTFNTYSFNVIHRRNLIAKVSLTPGTGNLRVNISGTNRYERNEYIEKVALQPLVVTKTDDKFDVILEVRGDNYKKYANNIRDGVAKALLQASTNYEPKLKRFGMLARKSNYKKRKTDRVRLVTKKGNLIKK